MAGEQESCVMVYGRATQDVCEVGGRAIKIRITFSDSRKKLQEPDITILQLRRFKNTKNGVVYVVVARIGRCS